jgi:uncharacterized coiled-coil protein SlyX
MYEIRQTTLDRLEARIDHQAARIDELFRLLKARGLIQDPADVPSDALCDELVQFEDSPLARERNTEPTPFHVGEATGV